MPEKIHVLNLSFLVNTHEAPARRRGRQHRLYDGASRRASRRLRLGRRERLGRYEAGCQKHGIDTRFIEVVPDEFTATCYMTTDLDNNQINWLLHRGNGP